MNTRHSILTLAMALALVAPHAHGMGLGQMQVKSGLNQPLVAEIPIISATPAEMSRLDVRLASPDAFARVGLDEPNALTANLQFSVGKNARGLPVIRVTTSSRFAEPILSFLIEADWGKGTVTREYTALIDPPYIAAAIVTPMQAPEMVTAPAPMPVPVYAPPPPQPAPRPAQTMAATEPAPVSVTPTPEPEPMVLPPPPPPVAVAPPPPEPTPMPAPVAARPTPRLLPPPPEPTPAPPPPAPAPAPAVANGQYGPVAAGQTLWSIAGSVRADSALSVNQMMLAILRANPDAFDQDNINQLKSGSVLRIPDTDEVSRLSPEQASALVHEQAAAWRSPRAPVPQPADVPNADAEPAVAKPEPRRAPKPPKTESPEAAKPATSVAANSGAAKPRRTHLEIVPPSGKSSAHSVESGAAAGAGGTELRAQLTQARENLAASKAENAELKSRVSDLEKQQGSRQRLIDLQNSQMKDLQDRLHQLETEQAAAAQAPVPEPTPAPATDASTVAAVSAPVPAPAVASAPETTESPPASATSVATEEEAGPAWYANPYLLGGGALVLIGGLVFALRRSRKPVVEEAPARRISEDDALRASLAATRKKPAPAPAPAAKVEAVPAAPVVVAPAPDKELQTMTAAVRSRPQDLEAHLNLLRHFHSHGDAVGYEAAAQAMRMQVSSTTDPRWREAVVMGAALLPGHPLFSQAGWNAPRFNEGDAAARPAETAPVVEEKPAPAIAVEAPAEIAAATDADDDDWNRAMGTHVEASPMPTMVAKAVSAPAAPDMSFDAPPMDIHRSEAEVLAEDEASATRIELAKAYLDIGDLEGARSMLEEVMADGGPSAKSVAQRILKEIG